MVKKVIKTILIINIINSYAITSIKCPAPEQIANCMSCDYTLKPACPGLTTTGIEMSPTNYDHNPINSSYGFLKASMELKVSDDGLSSKDTDNAVTILTCFYLDKANNVEHIFKYDYAASINGFLKNCHFNGKDPKELNCYGVNAEDCVLECEALSQMPRSMSLLSSDSPTISSSSLSSSSSLTSPVSLSVGDRQILDQLLRSAKASLKAGVRFAQQKRSELTRFKSIKITPSTLFCDHRDCLTDYRQKKGHIFFLDDKDRGIWRTKLDEMEEPSYDQEPYETVFKMVYLEMKQLVALEETVKDKIGSLEAEMYKLQELPESITWGEIQNILDAMNSRLKIIEKQYSQKRAEEAKSSIRSNRKRKRSDN